eukprot:CAMPEP_0180140296 /NCGR_PEP_ID=MMETSP0986-20121125/14130_1 /TAXON_ID=697907 /ORGANISM="non described non described, Strain CCMP2293" /LENGTH=103 /DNA_ID=CAMNT_0022082735 /DNA_START=85 /DNA_END=396 /DNA_ORIENTATION=-
MKLADYWVVLNPHEKTSRTPPKPVASPANHSPKCPPHLGSQEARAEWVNSGDAPVPYVRAPIELSACRSPPSRLQRDENESPHGKPLLGGAFHDASSAPCPRS